MRGSSEDANGGSDSEWTIAGHGKTDTKPTNKTYLPAHLSEEADIIRPEEEDVYWHYQKVSGICVIGNQQFEKSKSERKRRRDINHKNYEYIGETSPTPLRREENNEEITSLRTTIPKRFFDDFEGNRPHQEPVPQHARMRYDAPYYFIYHEDMAEGAVRSCYVLAPSELEKVLPESAEIDESGDFGDIPRFRS